VKRETSKGMALLHGQTRSPDQIAANLLRPKMGHRHLFVYGPNLDENLLRERCPRSGVSCTGTLRQPAVHDQFGKARHGLPPSGLPGLRCGLVRALDWISSARHPRRSPHWHDRFEVFARTANGQLCVSEFFATRNRTAGRADPAYLQPIIAAARRWKFPQQYIDEMGPARVASLRDQARCPMNKFIAVSSFLRKRLARTTNDKVEEFRQLLLLGDWSYNR
jgi:hypothetical protein